MGRFIDEYGEGEYRAQNFDQLAIQDEEIAYKDFDECRFQGCSFQETQFRGCRFLNCSFKNCDFQLISVNDCTFMNAAFEDSRVIGVNWIEASWPKRGLLTSLHFLRCVLNHSTFMGLPLRKMTFQECVAKDVDFAEANLTGADCRNTDFSQSRFFHTNLTQADFSGARNYEIAAHLNTLKKTKFSLPDAMTLLYSLDIVLTE